MTTKLPVKIVAVLLATSAATSSLKAEDLDPRYPGRQCFWYGSCPFSAASAGQCPAPYVDISVELAIAENDVSAGDRICAFTGWKNLCCEPLGYVTQDDKRASPPVSQPSNAPITFRPTSPRAGLDQPTRKVVQLRPGSIRPPLSQPSNAPISVQPADPSVLNLPVRKTVGPNLPYPRPGLDQPNKPLGPFPDKAAIPSSANSQAPGPHIHLPMRPYLPSRPGSTPPASTATSAKGAGAYPSASHLPAIGGTVSINKQHPSNLGKREHGPTAFRTTPSPTYRVDHWRNYKPASHRLRGAPATKAHTSKLR
jgi:hypothetical protein